MENVSKLVREVLSVDISLEKCCLSEMTGYIGEQRVKENTKRYQNVKADFYKINFGCETKVRSIYNDARFSIKLLKHEHLVKAIQTIRDYRHIEFFEELNSFYMRYKDGKADREQEEIWKQKLRNFFINDIPTNGRITDMFLSDVLIVLSAKYVYLNSLIKEMESMIENDKAPSHSSLAGQELQPESNKINTRTEDVTAADAEIPRDNSSNISSQTNALFKFVEFLHSNIDNFNQYDTIILELNKARDKIYKLGTHFTEMREKKALQKEIDIMWDVVIENIVNPLKDKVAELDLFDWSEPTSLPNNHFYLLKALSEKYEEEDLDIILKAKTQYIEFRNEISSKVINLNSQIFEYLNVVMSVIAKDFYEQSDIPIKNVEVKKFTTLPTPIDTHSVETIPNPESLDIPLSDDELVKHFNELVKTINPILHNKTDFDHFCYAISGHIIPIEKQPYKVIQLSDYIKRFYNYLNDKIVKTDQIKQQKYLPNIYRNKAKHLFIDKSGKSLNLSNPN